MILSEVAILGIAGALVGSVLGGALIYYLSIVGIPISESTMELMESFMPAEDALYPVFAVKYLVMPFLAAAVIPLAASIYPIFIMRRLQVKDALSHI
jgi:ABC-type lipoprotein release transport system permease subunit